MDKDQKERYTKPWQDFMDKYEKLYWSPGKPTLKEKEIFKRFLKELKANDSKGLVLGATPAMREALAELDIEITLIDASQIIIDAMTRLIEHDRKETKIVGDWLNMPFKDSTFDFVLGDLVLGNLSGKNKQNFLKEIKRVLKPTGYFIHRFFYIPDNWKPIPTEETFERFAKLDNPYDRSMEIFVHLLFDSYNKDKNEFDMKIVKEKLKKYWKDNKYQHENKHIEGLLNRAYEMWKPLDKVWHAGTKKEVFGWIEKEFKIIKQENDLDHMFGKWFPVVVCKPN